MTKDNFLESVRELLADDKLDEAIQVLRLKLKSRHLLDELILISSKFKKLQEQNRKGTIDGHSGAIARNKLFADILEMLLLINDEDYVTGNDEKDIDNKKSTSTTSPSQVINNNNANIKNQINIQEWKGGDMTFNS